ncbi:hypothetical protein U1Q18_051899 [Sarracenia purpurea var. burkii]
MRQESQRLRQCLPGYAQTNFISPNKKIVCSPVVTLAAPMTAEDLDQFAINPAMVIGLSMVGILAVTAFVSWKCYGKRSTAVIHDSWNEMGLSPRARCADGASLPPPSYEDCQRSESGSVAYSFQLRVMERPEKQTTAIPFQMPMGEHIVSLAQPSQENRHRTRSNFLCHCMSKAPLYFLNLFVGIALEAVFCAIAHRKPLYPLDLFVGIALEVVFSAIA